MVAIGRVGRRVVRATGRKDWHSKVYTSKGPRNRRVRLSPVTAIQFYDVQDRLGYDRPSEAVDWLIQKAKASIEALPQKPNVDPGSDGVTWASLEPNLLQELGNGVEDATESSQEKIQNLQHLGVDSINISPCCSMENFGLLSSDYIDMENSMPEFNYQLGNNTADTSLGIRSQEYVMLQEESMVSLPLSSRPDFDSTPSSSLDQVVLNPCQLQKIVSLNHKFSSKTVNHMQVCSLSKLFQSRDFSSALASSMDAPIWRVDSAQPGFHLPAIAGTGPVFHRPTKHYIPMQLQTGKEGVNAGTS